MNPDEVLASIEKVAPDQGLPIIGPNRGVFLDEAVIKYRPSTVLEVGTLVGYSAIRVARHLKKGQRLTCIEVNGEIAKVARSNIEKAGLSDRVEVIVGDGKKILASLPGPFDMVFLDAAKDEYLSYLKACEPKLHRGSVVVADNAKAHASAMADYLEYVKNSGRYSNEFKEAPPNYGIDDGDAVQISIKL